MLRTILLFIAFLVLIAIGLVATGLINLNREDDGGLSVTTSDVTVGTTTTNVQLPAVRIEDRQVEVPSVVIEGDSQDQPVNQQ
ncbi:MAG TPA: hypothetical protein VFO69_02515 [Allosphingosinicella sp.]|nr:hypothetical protein [Allosphingosinicella sp.]